MSKRQPTDHQATDPRAHPQTADSPGAESQSPDDAVIAALSGLTRPGWLVTVAATWGSSPRPDGSLLVIDHRGRETGSVSGGCVEADLVALALAGELIPDALPRRLSYGGDTDDARRFGLPCGGRLDLLCERITDPAPWQAIAGVTRTRGLIERRLALDTGSVVLQPISADTWPLAAPAFRLAGNHAHWLFGPRWRLLIIGAEAIALALAPIAHSLGYRVIICDPRDDRLAAFASNDVDRDPRMPDDAVRAWAGTPRTAVVALTHDPRLDDLALMEALLSPAFYVGALGSRRTQAARRARLAELGLPSAAIARLHGPVGLDLGGKTPAEIAVSIAADLIACRNRGACAVRGV